MHLNNIDPNNEREWFTNLTIVDALYQGLVGEDKEQHIFQGEALAPSHKRRAELLEDKPPGVGAIRRSFDSLMHVRCESLMKHSRV